MARSAGGMGGLAAIGVSVLALAIDSGVLFQKLMNGVKNGNGARSGFFMLAPQIAPMRKRSLQWRPNGLGNAKFTGDQLLERELQHSAPNRGRYTFQDDLECTAYLADSLSVPYDRRDGHSGKWVLFFFRECMSHRAS